MGKIRRLPTIDVPRELGEWIDEQAKGQDRGVGPYIRRLLSNIKSGRVVVIENRPGFEIEYRPVENLQKREEL